MSLPILSIEIWSVYNPECKFLGRCIEFYNLAKTGFRSYLHLIVKHRACTSVTVTF